jgi:hypothetical protein
MRSRRARLAKSVFRGINPRKTQNITIFTPSHGTHSCAKILFVYAEKDGRAKTATNENILVGWAFDVTALNRQRALKKRRVVGAPFASSARTALCFALASSGIRSAASRRRSTLRQVSRPRKRERSLATGLLLSKTNPPTAGLRFGFGRGLRRPIPLGERRGFSKGNWFPFEEAPTPKA